MVIIDKQLQELEKQSKPIRVGMIGAGFMARGVAFQIINLTKGMYLAAIANRSIRNAIDIYKEAGIPDPVCILNDKSGHKTDRGLADIQRIDKYIVDRKNIVTSDPYLLCKSQQIDVILEMTGSIDYGAQVIMEAIKNKKHVVSFNAELDGTIGPILKNYADKAGVVYTLAGGDQPGVTMDLYKYVVGIGMRPVLCGNIKGLHDPHRTPTTQAEFARKWHQRPSMVTSFADGTKISFEQAVIANATGMKVAKRGMYGHTVPEGTHIEEIAKYFSKEDLESKNGIVDYVVGAHPPGGVFVLARAVNQKQCHYLSYYKMGDGPFYCFYAPYHLCHFEIPASIARSVLFHDPTISPAGRPMVEVITVAKKDIKKGEVLDQLGGYTVYGLCENYDTARQENLLPIGLAEGCELKRGIREGQAISLNDVIIPDNSFAFKLWEEQLSRFPYKSN